MIRGKQIVHITVLILAGEMIFSLPFHTARFFRPTLLGVFGFSNTQLGDACAAYGATAMLAYFPGGLVADRFSTRALLLCQLLPKGTDLSHLTPDPTERHYPAPGSTPFPRTV